MASPLLPFTGGLRAQSPFIIQAIQHFLDARAAAPSLCDPFFGGGSISYEARQRGLHVWSSDLARRSYYPAAALIANSKVIPADTVARLLSPHPDEHDYEGESVQRVLYDEPLALARRVWHNAQDDSERYLAERFLLDLVPVGGFGLMKRTEQSDGAKKGWSECFDKLLNPGATLDRLRRMINNGIAAVAESPEGEVWQRDALEHIAEAAQAGMGAVHIDPPTYGTKGYTNLYWWLDWFVGQSSEEEGTSFSRKEALGFLDQCLAQARSIPVACVTQQAVSYPMEDAVAALEAHGRTVTCYQVPKATTRNPFYIAVGVE